MVSYSCWFDETVETSVDPESLVVNQKMGVKEDQKACVGLDDMNPDCGKAAASDDYRKEMVDENSLEDQLVLNLVDLYHIHCRMVETHVSCLVDHAYVKGLSASFHDTEKSHVENSLID